MNENEAIQAYLRSLGVDPGLFGTYGAGDINALQQYDAGTGDYANWDWRSVQLADAMKALQADPTNNQYTVGIGDRFSTKGDNYGVQLDPSTGGFVLRAKVGNKDSVEVPYKQQPDGSWAPDWQAARAASWDTNAGNKRDIRGMATVLGAAAGGYLANSAGLFGVDPSAAASTGAAAQGASGAVNPYALTAADFASASAPASAWGGGTGVTSAMGLVPEGMSSASLFTPGAGVVAGEGGAATLGSAAAGVAGSVPSAVVDAVNTAVNTGQSLESLVAANPSLATEISKLGGSNFMDLVKQYGPDVLKALTGGTAGGPAGDLISGLLGAGGTYLQDRSAEQANDAMLRERISGAGQMRDAVQQFAPNFDPFYANVDNGYAKSNIDPTTGKVSYDLNPEYQRIKDQYSNQFGMFSDQIGKADPNQFAKNWYDQQQGLLSEGRQLGQQNLMQELYNKGGFGLTLNQPRAASAGVGPNGEPIVQAGQGSVGVNPYVDTFVNANNRTDAGIASQAFDKGQSWLDTLLKRQDSAASGMYGVQDKGRTVLDDASNWSNNFMGARRKAGEFGVGVARDYYGAVDKARQDALAADTLRRSNMYAAAFGNGAGGGSGGAGGGNWVQRLPWDSIWKTVGSWLG